MIAYDSRIRTLQDFTSDPDLITKAMTKISPGSYANRMIDAVAEGDPDAAQAAQKPAAHHAAMSARRAIMRAKPAVREALDRSAI